MWAVLLALSSVGLSDGQLPVTVTKVAATEDNHYYSSEDETRVFRQLIFYDWCDKTEGFRVTAWRFVNQDNFWNPAKGEFVICLRDFSRRGGYTLYFQDKEYLRCIRMRGGSTTKTYFDPEAEDRKLRPAHQRADLGIRPPLDTNPPTGEGPADLPGP